MGDNRVKIMVVAYRKDKDDIIPDMDVDCSLEGIKHAERLADSWSITYQNHYVFITYFRYSDGLHGYFNRSGFDNKGQAW